MAAPTLNATGIRTDLVSRLSDETSAEDRVYDSRKLNFESDEFPALSISSIGANDDKWSIGVRLVEHTERIAIVGGVKGTSEADVAAALDTLETGVYDTLAEATEWVKSFESIEKVESAKEVDKSTADIVGNLAVVIELHYSVKYTPSPAPGALTQVVATTDTADPAGADVSARDLLEED